MDNRYQNYNCPALMSDARFITNYMESRVFEQYIRNINNIESAQEYRLFLQQNGDRILNKERAYFDSINTCSVQGKCVPLNGSPEKEGNAACGCACNKPK